MVDAIGVLNRRLTHLDLGWDSGESLELLIGGCLVIIVIDLGCASSFVVRWHLNSVSVVSQLVFDVRTVCQGGIVQGDIGGDEVRHDRVRYARTVCLRVGHEVEASGRRSAGGGP